MGLYYGTVTFTTVSVIPVFPAATKMLTAQHVDTTVMRIPF